METAIGGGTGPTVAIKDMIDVAGSPTRGGSRALSQAAQVERAVNPTSSAGEEFHV